MDEVKYIKKFKEFGLTEREAKVYITLLTKKVFTAAELQHSVNIPGTKIYVVLQKMIGRGTFVERRLGRNKVYEAVDPNLAFKPHIDDFRTELYKKKT